MSKTIEQEANILHFIENCQGHSTRGGCRNDMYDIYAIFKNDGRNANVCTCLDRDTAKKVDNFISAYTFSDEIRFTDRFHKLLPHLALIKEEAKKPLEEESNTDLSEGMSKFVKKKAKSVPVKPVKRKKRTTKKKK
jgi:hypothetical protein